MNAGIKLVAVNFGPNGAASEEYDSVLGCGVNGSLGSGGAVDIDRAPDAVVSLTACADGDGDSLSVWYGENCTVVEVSGAYQNAGPCILEGRLSAALLALNYERDCLADRTERE